MEENMYEGPSEKGAQCQ